ncbi:cation:proton antiporter domain-containing protein [Amycolatopsis speibonae]|uniref:Cation:proton antiporter n=1 Tax=Amycolatopsis speibonae TaxID=1450224 RepID=A0ABV7P7A1_9PSEU
MEKPATKRHRLWPWLVVCAVLVAAAVFGAAQFPGPRGAEPQTPPSSIPQWRALLAVSLVVLVARLGGTLATRLGQARVLGEVVAGVLLGPSLLGAVWPAAQLWLFDPGVRATMETLAQLGVLVFMFLVGMESAVPSQGVPLRPVVAIGFFGLAVPFALGVLLAAILSGIPRLGLPNGGDAAFALFIGVSLSVTALPVLARLVVLLLGVVRRGLGRLGERRVDRIPSGVSVGLLG